MCDIQILTGLGILVSAFANLCKGISAYHFLVIGHVAWFSNLTHIAGLTVLRRYLFLRPVEKWVRLFLMITLTIMLLVAMGPTVFFDWTDNHSASTPGTDAVCFYDVERALKWQREATTHSVGSTQQFLSVITSMVLSVLSLTSRIIKLQRSLSSAVTTFRRKCSDLWKQLMSCLSHGCHQASGLNIALRQFILHIQVANLCLVRLYSDILSSNLSDVSSPAFRSGLFLFSSYCYSNISIGVLAACLWDLGHN